MLVVCWLYENFDSQNFVLLGFPIHFTFLLCIPAEVFEEVLEIVSYMTFFSPNISLDMWSLWPLMMEALADWAIDFFPSMNLTPFLLQFISISFCKHLFICFLDIYIKAISWTVHETIFRNKLAGMEKRNMGNFLAKHDKFFPAIS